MKVRKTNKLVKIFVCYLFSILLEDNIDFDLKKKLFSSLERNVKIIRNQWRAGNEIFEVW